MEAPAWRDSVEALEDEIRTLTKTVESKDKEIKEMHRQLEKAQLEVHHLKGLKSEMLGKDEAIAMAAKQNRSLLQVLQEADAKCRELSKENGELRAEVKRHVTLSEKRLKRSNTQNDRLRTALRCAERHVTVATLASRATQQKLDAVEKTETDRTEKLRWELDLVHSELDRRKEQQYALTAKLLRAEDHQYDLDRRCDQQEHLVTAQADHVETLQKRLHAVLDDLDDKEKALASMTSDLLTTSAQAAAATARQQLQLQYSNKLQEALDLMTTSRTAAIQAKDSLQTRISMIQAAKDDALLEATKLRARVDHTKLARDHHRSDCHRLEKKLRFVGNLVRKQKSIIRSSSETDPRQRKRSPLTIGGGDCPGPAPARLLLQQQQQQEQGPQKKHRSPSRRRRIHAAADLKKEDASKRGGGLDEAPVPALPPRS